ncbi:hypothetical protein [Zunongwangia atlantica]|uniref:Lipoprotein n=1 Tax=Zunongwangia atlantica 22II14-10F7 TaxID=1185767 RepID=A0A1Y1T030_9FLAO|nr:hypothetical protein [Zunongwangia atlantica]ORL44357.1 hypothetical protein IIF7_16607 [Zunongwangia atlantica 22II14-10F7]
MKQKLYILIFAIGLLSCDKNLKKIDNTTGAELYTQNQDIDNSKFYTQKDTILITTELNDTLKFAKDEFNNIINKHPEFFEDYPNDPDQLYFNDNDKGEFRSEFEQDIYYTLYAYFLKQKNGEKKYEKERKKLIYIYLNINSLFQHFQYGGTYFGHQQSRILGYAEYSIYLLPKSKEDFQKTYDISKQKDLYIKSLKQLVADESEIDFNTLGEAKIERTTKLNKIVDEIDELITDIFYLRRAQNFQYTQYQYY